MRLPVKPKQLPTTMPILSMRRATAMAVAMAAGLLARPRMISTSRMTCAGLKKCMPTNLLRTGRGRGERVDVERRGVRGQHCVGAAQPIQGAEDILLDGQTFEHRLDDEVGRRCRFQLAGAGYPGHGSGRVCGSQAALPDRATQACGDAPEPGIDHRIVLIDERDRVAGGGKTRGDPAAHGAGAHDRHEPYGVGAVTISW